MKRFEGIYPAIITPIDEMEQINEKALAQVIERSVAQGVAGFYVSGSTGESFLLRDEQRAQLIRVVCEIVGGRRDVIANIGAFSTKGSIELAHVAVKKRRDGCLRGPAVLLPLFQAGDCTVLF